MRRKFWLQFHLWTVALLAVLTIANVASALRPFSPRSASHDRQSSAPLRLVNSENKSARQPASDSNQSTGQSSGPTSNQTLKLAQLPCEPQLRLVVTEHVKNLRLQFDICAKTDDVVSIRNTTNGFEGTVFGNTTAKAETDQDSNEIAGNFIEADRPLPKPRARQIASISKDPTKATTVSTDYIALAPGINEIQIQRSSRQQVLKIERR